MTPFPGRVADKLTVSQLNHNITSYKPIYPGDTLYTVINSRTFMTLPRRKAHITATLFFRPRPVSITRRAKRFRT